MSEMITNRTSKNTYYNYTDLNRVEAKTAEIADLLTAQGYFTSITVKTNWGKGDYPTAEQMERYLGNVQKCVDNFCAVPGVTLPESMKKLLYTDANNIEKTLAGIERLIDYMLSVMRNCGTFYSGHMSGLRGCSL